MDLPGHVIARDAETHIRLATFSQFTSLFRKLSR
jgi:hypothetical protein